MMELSGKTVVITGGSGMAGSAVSRALNSFEDIKIRLISRNIDNYCVNQKNVEIETFDLLSTTFRRNPFEGADFAILCAAETSGLIHTNTKQFDQFLLNSQIDINSLKLATEAGVKKIIYVGTASSYQEHEGYITENMMDWTEDPSLAHFGVGWSKRVAEKFCQFLYMEKNVEIAVLRLANIYGPNAKFNPKTSNFIPALIRKAVDKLDPFPVWGSPDIKRDIIYVDDFASAVIRCLLKVELGFNTFNIGSGKIVNVGTIVDLVLKLTNHEPREIKFGSGPTSSLSFRALNCNKAENILDWKSTTSNKEGLKYTINWWMENKEKWKK